MEVNRNGDNSEEKAKNSGGEVNRGVKEVQKKWIVEVGRLESEEVEDENNVLQAVRKLERKLRLLQRLLKLRKYLARERRESNRVPRVFVVMVREITIP